jgi:hypothetical protein
MPFGETGNGRCRAPMQICAAILFSGCQVGQIGGLVDDPSDVVGGDEVGQIDTKGSALCEAGRVTLRRLNRREYSRTVRDLVGDTTNPGDSFPADDFGYGFDNIADVLSISPLLFEKYEASARKVIEAAVRRERTVGSDASALGYPPIFVCEPQASEPGACATEILSRFARRAYRRPVEPQEIAPLVALTDLVAQEGDGFDEAITVALTAVLTSPHFLYLVELDKEPGSNGVHRLSSHEFATRLSYFLWSSMPDEVLMGRADDGSIFEVSVLRAEVARMLSDERSDVFVEHFVGQWLQGRGLPDVAPDPDKFPEWDQALAQAMAEETRLLFRSFLDSGRNALDLLTADFTFLNDRLAQHYGLPQPSTGSVMTQVDLPAGGPRRGVLAHGGFLAVTSKGLRTSPVKRGAVVLEELLCTPPPPPPPNVEGFPEQVNPNASLRVRMEQHQSDPTCRSCHTLMDPIGFGLEHFDAIGKFRTDDEGYAIDSTGEIAGARFNGAAELASVLRADERLPWCMAKKLSTYALGRGPRPDDACAQERLVGAFSEGGYSLEALISAIVESPVFVTRRDHDGQGE